MPEFTVPLPDPAHDPFESSKHPAERRRPFANVEVAEPVTERPPTESPFVTVEVPEPTTARSLVTPK